MPCNFFLKHKKSFDYQKLFSNFALPNLKKGELS